MRFWHALLLSTLTLAGCATAPPQITPDEAQHNWQVRQQQLETLDNWGFSGRIAVTTDNESLSGTIHWKQLADTYDIRIIGPLGKGTVSLLGDPMRVVLTTDNGESYFANTAEALLLQQLGLRIPVSYLQHWLLGSPVPHRTTDDLQLDAAGRITSLSQAGWHISYRRYGAGPGMELPQKIFINNHQLSVRLVVDQWTLPTG